MRNVLPEEIEKAKKNIDLNNNLKDFMGEDWLNSHLQIEERYKKHPIFWELIDSNACLKLSNNLTILNSCCNKYQRIIRKLKSDKDKFNFLSLLTEIEVMVYYYEKHGLKNLEYEPEINESNKKADARVIIDGKEYYFEILTVFKDEVGQTISEIHNIIKKKINNINQPFRISFKTSIHFMKQNIDGFVNFVRTLLKNKASIKTKNSFKYLRNNKKIARITFHSHPIMKNGSVEYSCQPMRAPNLPGRIKNKVLSKIDQFPENTKNIVIINLTCIPNDFSYVEDAFFGQSCTIINKKTLKVKPSRHSNGIINHEKGKSISMIIAYTNWDYNNRKFYLNLSAQNVIDKKIIGKL